MAPRQALCSLLLLLTVSAGLCNMSEAVGAAPSLTQGDILFADPTALYTPESGDEFEFDGRGAIFRHSAISASYGILSEGQSFIDPTNLAIEPTGKVVVVDQNWGESQGDTSGAGGAVLRVDPSQPSASNATVVASGNFFRDPVGIAVNPTTGTIYVCDRNSTSPGFVVSIDPSTGAQTLLSDAGSLVNPQDMVWNPQDSMLYVVDPLVDNLDSGQVIKIDPSTGAQTVVSEEGDFVDPVGIGVAADGDLWVSDEEAGENQFGSIIKVNRTTGVQTVLTTEGNFEHPHDVALLQTGNLVVTDPVANLGAGEIVHVSTATGAQILLSLSGASDGNYIEPLGVVVVPNLPPVVQGNKTVTIAEDSVITALDITTPVDPEGETVTITVDTLPDPAKGSVHLAGGGAVTLGPLSLAELSGLTFNTVPNANGAAGTFTYTASDGVLSATQVVTLDITPVNDVPVAYPQMVSLQEDGSLAITLSGADVETPSASLSYSVVTGPSHGVLTGTEPNLTYTPTVDYYGTDSFTFRAFDGTDYSLPATISITVIRNNIPPVAQGDKTLTVLEDAMATSLAITAPTDEDEDTLTITVTAIPDPAKGEVINAGGTAYAVGNMLTGAQLVATRFRPSLNANGSAGTFAYTVDDGKDGTDSQIVTLEITPVNDRPVSADQSVTTDEDIAKAITLSATDVEGDARTYEVVTNPSHGTLSGTAPNVTYTPTANYHGPDSFTFKAKDYEGVFGNTATVSITVVSVNDLPVAVGETYGTRRGTTLEVAAPGVLGNDTDVDLDTLTAQLVTGPTGGGSFTLNPNGSFRYTPRIGFSGADSFTYRPYDGTEVGNTVTVTINVSPEPPDSTPNGKADATGSIAVTGGTASFTLTARKTSGIVMGSFTYTDPDRTRSVSSTQLTAVVLTGRKARIFGKGKLPSGVAVDFVIDVNDIAEPGRLKDTFQIEISTGPTIGGVLTVGNVSIDR